MIKYIYIFLTIYFLKLIYDFGIWLYGYFLRIKWISYFNNNKGNAISYTYQIQKYLNNAPLSDRCDNVFSTYHAKDTLNLFIESHGYYRYKFFQNFNPFYWLKLIIYLPQNFLHFLGFKSNRRFLKIINVIFWIGAVVYSVYNTEINNFIKDIVKLIFEYFTKK